MAAKSRFDQAEKYREMMECAESYVMTVRPLVDAPNKVADFMQPLTAELTQEKLFVLMADTKNRIIHCEAVTTGLVDRSQVHAREIFRKAIIHNASRIIIAHNHPSGDPTPSSADITCTNGLVAAGKVVGIEVLDHVIIGKTSQRYPSGYVSMKQENLM